MSRPAPEHLHEAFAVLVADELDVFARRLPQSPGKDAAGWTDASVNWRISMFQPCRPEAVDQDVSDAAETLRPWRGHGKGGPWL